jgi:uncharacterized protein with HEPN domain
MSENLLRRNLDRMKESASDAARFLEDMDKEAFLADIIRQRAVGMCLLMLGEATKRLMDDFPDFVVDHPEVKWQQIGGMRNHITHGYFDIDLGAIWNVTKMSVPELLDQLDAIDHWRAEGE